MDHRPEIQKVIIHFATIGLTESYARKWFAHCDKIGWEKIRDPMLSIRRWAENARPEEHIGYVPAKDLTPTEPLARGQPTFAMNRVEPPRELTEDEKVERAAMIVELKAEPLAPLLVSLRQRAILWQKTPTLVPGMTQELYDRVMRYDEAIRRLRINKEEYL